MKLPYVVNQDQKTIIINFPVVSAALPADFHPLDSTYFALRQMLKERH